MFPTQPVIFHGTMCEGIRRIEGTRKDSRSSGRAGGSGLRVAQLLAQAGEDAGFSDVDGVAGEAQQLGDLADEALLAGEEVEGLEKQPGCLGERAVARITLTLPFPGPDPDRERVSSRSASGLPRLLVGASLADGVVCHSVSPEQTADGQVFVEERPVNAVAAR
jgi:hypothetical protein